MGNFASASRLLHSLSLTESAAAISLDKKLLFSQSSLDKATCCKQRLSYACRFRRLTHAQSASPPWWCAVKPRRYGETDFCAACVAGVFVSGEARFRVGVEQQARRANAMIGLGDAVRHQAKRPICAFISRQRLLRHTAFVVALSAKRV